MDSINDSANTIPQAFDAVVRAHGQRIALAGGEWEPTYQDLDGVSNRLANDILSRGGNQGDRVALLMSHDSPLVAAMLGVWKAGRVTVVLNPSDPPARQTEVLLNSEPALIMTDTLHHPIGKSICGDAPVTVFSRTECGRGSLMPPRLKIGSDDTAALVYTSGSTGRPKAVMRTHGLIQDCTRRFDLLFELDHRDRIAGLTPLSGSLGQNTICRSLLAGSTVHLLSVADRGVVGLADWLRDNRITYYSTSSSLLRSFLKTLKQRDRLEDVRVVMLAADSATVADVTGLRRHFGKNCALIHCLSSSETGVIAAWKDAGEDLDGERLPVGFPVPGIELSLQDECGNEVANGHAGEIVVRSRYLAAGYWRRPELTAERFRTETDASGQTVTVFCSGDRAQRQASGSLIHAGRSDGRLKIRGFRIEPSDIEFALRSIEEVEQAVVLEVPGPEGNPILAAAVVAREPGRFDSRTLRIRLRTSLPDYMIPARILPVEEFPLTPNGKVDRERLRQLFDSTPPTSPADPPQTDTERRLAAIWEMAFSRSPIACGDDFFDIGGDSLIATVIAAHVHAEWGVEISLRSFADGPNLRALAKRIERSATHNIPRPEPSVPAVPHDQPLPLSFSQEAIWHDCRTPEGMRGWTVSADYRLSGPVQVDVLRACLLEMQRRHEILRTTFELHEGSPRAVVRDMDNLAFEVVDFSAQPEQADRFCREMTRNIEFHLERLPLMRFWLLRIGKDNYRLLRIHHHILSDQWSWNIYFDELAQLYEARRSGGNLALSATRQYADYAALQRAAANSETPRFRRDIDWWMQHLSPPPPPLELPFARAAPWSEAAPEHGVIPCPIPPDVSQQLNLVAARFKTTYVALRLAVFLAALGEATGQTDLMIGSYFTGRTRLEWQRTFGMFANQVIFRLQWNPAASFGCWLRSVSDTIAKTQQHGEISHTLLREQLAQEEVLPPAINAMFSQSEHNPPHSFGGLELSRARRIKMSMPWGFTMNLVSADESRCYAEFDARLYDPEQVRTFLLRYRELLGILSHHPDCRLDQAMQSSTLAESKTRFDARTRLRDAA